MCPLYAYTVLRGSHSSGRSEEKTRAIILPHIHSVLSLGLIFWFVQGSFWGGGLSMLGGDFSMAAARPPVETKKKQDISFFHTYAVFLSWCLTLPSMLAGSFYTHNMCALFDYAGYAAVRAPVETKKKQGKSSLHTYTGYAAAWAPVELKKNKIYHSSTHTQCFSPCLLY